jgi:magnesium chelatase subunit D
MALRLLGSDPAGLGGLWLRARSGPVRDRLLADLATLPLPVIRLHPGMEAEALEGGLDLTATLAGGRMVMRDGLLSLPAILVLSMAERCPPGLAARLAQLLDRGQHALIAVDEGADPSEGLAPALADRLAFFAELDGIRHADSFYTGPLTATPGTATLLPDALDALTRTAALAGIDSLRAPRHAAAAARALACLDGRDTVEEDDLRLAAELTLAHRATVSLADDEDDDQPQPPEQTDIPEDRQSSDETQALPDDILLDAIRTALPADLLARLAAGRAARQAKGATGTGATKRGNRRGRPLPARPGRLDGHARIDLVATLRAAAPWQTVRRKATGRHGLLELRAEDIRLKQAQERSDRLLIFTVDASGSSALARLAEAKGAVELLLAQAYARRDHVALVAFRGAGAEVLLPPTRSLVQTKRRLASLPGGGATPMASGLAAAMELGLHARARGMTPTVALLTDGRPNVGRDGNPGRPQAEADAEAMARLIRAHGLPALVVDTGNRPTPWLQALARSMDATFLPLPRAEAHRLSAALSTALGD